MVQILVHSIKTKQNLVSVYSRTSQHQIYFYPTLYVHQNSKIQPTIFLFLNIYQNLSQNRRNHVKFDAESILINFRYNYLPKIRNDYRANFTWLQACPKNQCREQSRRLSERGGQQEARFYLPKEKKAYLHTHMHILYTRWITTLYVYLYTHIFICIHPYKDIYTFIKGDTYIHIYIHLYLYIHIYTIAHDFPIFP